MDSEEDAYEDDFEDGFSDVDDSGHEAGATAASNSDLKQSIEGNNTSAPHQSTDVDAFNSTFTSKLPKARRAESTTVTGTPNSRITQKLSPALARPAPRLQGHQSSHPRSTTMVEKSGQKQPESPTMNRSQAFTSTQRAAGRGSVDGNHEQESNAATSGQNAYTSKVVYIPPHGQAGMRVASASNRRLAKVRNKLSEKEKALAAAQLEIKTLQDMLRRQDKALTKYTATEADLPATLRKKDEEIRVLDAQLRKHKEKLKEVAVVNKKHEKSVLNLQDQNRALEGMVRTKGLKSRAALTKQVDELKTELAQRNEYVARLEVLVANAEKDRRRTRKAKPGTTPADHDVAQLKQDIARLHGVIADLRRRAGASPTKADATATQAATIPATTSTTVPATIHAQGVPDEKPKPRVRDSVLHQPAVVAQPRTVSPPPPTVAAVASPTPDPNVKSTDEMGLITEASVLLSSIGKPSQPPSSTDGQLLKSHHNGRDLESPLSPTKQAAATAFPLPGGVNTHAPSDNAPIVISSPPPTTQQPPIATNAHNMSISSLSPSTETTWQPQAFSPSPTGHATGTTNAASPQSTNTRVSAPAPQLQPSAEQQAQRDRELAAARATEENERKQKDALLAKLAALDNAAGKTNSVHDTPPAPAASGQGVVAPSPPGGVHVTPTVPLWMSEKESSPPKANANKGRGKAPSPPANNKSAASTAADVPMWLGGSSSATAPAKHAPVAERQDTFVVDPSPGGTGAGPAMASGSGATAGGSGPFGALSDVTGEAHGARRDTYKVGDGVGAGPAPSSNPLDALLAETTPTNPKPVGRRLGAANAPVLPSIGGVADEGGGGFLLSSTQESTMELSSPGAAPPLPGIGATTAGTSVRAPAPPSGPNPHRSPRDIRRAGRNPGGAPGGSSLAGFSGPRRNKGSMAAFASRNKGKPVVIADVEDVETLSA